MFSTPCWRRSTATGNLLTFRARRCRTACRRSASPHQAVAQNTKLCSVAIAFTLPASTSSTRCRAGRARTARSAPAWPPSPCLRDDALETAPSRRCRGSASARASGLRRAVVEARLWRCHRTSPGSTARWNVPSRRDPDVGRVSGRHLLVTVNAGADPGRHHRRGCDRRAARTRRCGSRASARSRLSLRGDREVPRLVQARRGRSPPASAP